jgi:hypothetical protein
MKCAFLIPTANPALCASTFAKWRAMGWDTFAMSDTAPVENATGVFWVNEYQGWPGSFNLMAEALSDRYDWLATGGDDVMPPNYDAEELSGQLRKHFGGTLGVCQGTADRWAFDKNGTAEPICYAPIFGAEYFERRGGLHPGYYHWYSDADLYHTAKDALWLRDDLFIEHAHVAKRGLPSPDYKKRIEHRWRGDKEFYEQRKRDGFPS